MFKVIDKLTPLKPKRPAFAGRYIFIYQSKHDFPALA